MSMRDEFVQIMNAEGAASENGFHSWRCFDKGRYPEPCRCTEVVAEMLVTAALRDAVAATRDQRSKFKARDWDDAIDAVVAAIEALVSTPDVIESDKEQHPHG